ncbi:MAG TPA: STAS domain-containing protein [Bryobacteraceae bacterium]|nr:STAS domain-containing protein [Bryobacteraceae bacterium]
MTPAANNAFSEVFATREPQIMKDWLDIQSKSGQRRSASEQQEIKRDSQEFMTAFQTALRSGASDDLSLPAWSQMNELLARLSSRRAKAGYSPTETASFVFSLKEPLFSALQTDLKSKPEAFLDALWLATNLIDKLGLLTMEAFQRTREELISRQQQEMIELSTPVVRLWDNILALPLIGTLDSARTQIVMQNLLEAIVQTRSDFAIIDITGVPVVDTLVAQHLLKTVAAARLMGADCLISGIRPQIAQTIIHLGVDLSEVTTKATLADAFAIALKRGGHKLTQGEKANEAGAR